MSQAQAEPIFFTGSDATLSASVQFELTTTSVKVTLTNTAGPSLEKLLPADVLTAVYFNLTGGATVTPFSAVLMLGNAVLPSRGAAAGAINGYWSYNTDLQNAALRGAHSGISSTGLGIFGPNGNFNCGAFCQPLDGLNYGIVPASYRRGRGNTGVERVPLIQYSAIFELRGTVAPNATVDDVWFQYGTDLSEPGFGGHTPVPEPSPAVLIGCGLLLVALSGQIRKRLRRGP